MAKKVAGKMYESITGQLFEIGRQLRQSNGYPFDPEKLKTHLQSAIEGRFHIASRDQRFWKTIQLGTGLKTADDFRRALKGNGCRMFAGASEIIVKPEFAASISPVAEEINLCVATTRELIGRAGTLAEIYAGIKKIGGELLPAEAGPQLRLQYMDQPNGEWLLVAMEPIKDYGCNLSVFHVERDGNDFWLYTNCDVPGCAWSPDYRWVFARRK